MTLAPICPFQSTLPHGERQRAPHIGFLHLPISIHAPAWGATRSFLHGSLTSRYFNPRSRMGSDAKDYDDMTLTAQISIHAPAWGATATTDSIFRYVDDIIRYCEQCAAAVAY